jgi:hypothetical protein
MKKVPPVPQAGPLFSFPLCFVLSCFGSSLYAENPMESLAR